MQPSVARSLSEPVPQLLRRRAVPGQVPLVPEPALERARAPQRLAVVQLLAVVQRRLVAAQRAVQAIRHQVEVVPLVGAKVPKPRALGHKVEVNHREEAQPVLKRKVAAVRLEPEVTMKVQKAAQHRELEHKATANHRKAVWVLKQPAQAQRVRREAGQENPLSHRHHPVEPPTTAGDAQPVTLRRSRE